MKYTFTQKNLTLQDANRALLLLWGTIDDDKVDSDYLDQFVKDRITLYQMLDKEVRSALEGVSFLDVGPGMPGMKGGLVDSEARQCRHLCKLILYCIIIFLHRR